MSTPSNDLAKNPGLPLDELENFIKEIELQPVWRLEASRSADYYDSKQLDAEIYNGLKERGQAPLVFNLIAPAIDAVLGMEAKTRSDWLVKPDGDRDIEVAEASNEKLNEAARLTYANRACSDAYAAQVKTGLGWVEVNRNSDPFAYAYRCNYIHRREIYWDWHAKRPDLKDARYLVREKWLDEDQALVAFPEHERIINAATNGWSNFSYTFDEDRRAGGNMHSANPLQYNSDLGDDYWFDQARARIRTTEVWYRVYKSGIVLKSKDGSAVVYDPKNPAHTAAIAIGMAKPIKGIYPSMRLAFYLGPYRVIDIASPLPHDNFPYVPFWGFREDRTSIPYGLIRRMMSPQDEINARRSKMMWLLSAKRIVMDSDATDMSLEQVSDEANRGDGIILLNPDRKHRDKHSFDIQQDFQLAAEQFKVMKDAEDMINQTSGIYQALQGRGGESQSGVAISSLVEQSSTTLAELNDNYRFARQQVGEHLLALTMQDVGKNQESVVINAGKPSKTKTIVLNEPMQQEQGHSGINNNVILAKTRVVLDDITATAGYRAQIANRLFDIAGTLPENLKATVMPILIDATDIPQREEMSKEIRKALGGGVDPSELSEDEQAALEAKQQQEEEARQQAFDEVDAKIEKIRAEAEKLAATTKSAGFDDRKTEAETEKLLAEMRAAISEVNSMKEDQINRVDAENEILASENALSALELAEAVA